MKNSIVPAAPFRETSPAQPAAGTLPLEIVPAEPIAEDIGGDGSAKLRRYLAAAKRFRWLIGAFAALGTIAGVAATRYVEPVYAARGAVWIADVSAGNNGAYRPPELLPNGSWIQLIRSFRVVDQVVADQRLFLKPKTWQDSIALGGLLPTPKTIPGDYTLWVDSAKGRYSLGEAQKGIFEHGSIGDSVGRAVGFAWLPTLASLKGRPSVRFGVLAPRGISVDLIGRLDVAMQDNSNFMNLTLTGPDKYQTADLLNAWMQQFVAAAADLRRRSLVDQATQLEAQRGLAENGLRGAEGALQAFRTQSITKPSEGTLLPSGASSLGITPPQDALAGQFFKSQMDYQELRRNREAIEALIPAARQGNFAADALAAVPAISSAPALGAALKDLVEKESQLRTLKQGYTDEFPAVKQLTAAVVGLRTQTIPNLMQVQVDLLRQREARLATDVQADSAQLQSIPARTVEQARLQRNLSTAENLYNNVENRYNSAKLGAESAVPDVSILDPALPGSSAQRNTKVMLVIGGFGAALAFGVVIALLLDMIDHRFRYQEQVADELGLEVIGAVPTVPKPTESEKDPEAVLQSVEAFRSLRMNIHHAFSAPPVMLTISSPGVGDGKSMITSNLALSFAEAGFRTLLIDGDIRRGKLHSIFGIDRRPGLLDYLAGDADVQSILREVPVHGALTLISSGTRRHRGPELLTSAKMPALLNMMRSRYDVILVDSAPLAAGVDAYALGVATRNMILVMRTGHTDRRVAKAKLKLLERLPLRVLGVVVNAVAPGEIYSEYSYLYGYGPDADVDDSRADNEVEVLRSGPTENVG